LSRYDSASVARFAYGKLLWTKKISAPPPSACGDDFAALDRRDKLRLPMFKYGPSALDTAAADVQKVGSFRLCRCFNLRTPSASPGRLTPSDGDKGPKPSAFD
jgi:hypothetical protein